MPKPEKPETILQEMAREAAEKWPANLRTAESYEKDFGALETMQIGSVIHIECPFGSVRRAL